MRVVIDRFENNYAVVETEDKKFYNIDKNLLVNAKEGDVIDIFINTEETKKRNISISNLVNKLFKE